MEKCYSKTISKRLTFEECVKDIRQLLLINFFLTFFEKTEVLLLEQHAVRIKLYEYIVTLDGLSVASCAAVKDRRN